MTEEQLAIGEADQAASSENKTQHHEVALAVRNTLKLGGSLLITWSVALLVKLQLPRHLGPVVQGHFGFADSFAAMFFTATGLGVDTYVMKEVSIRPKHASDFVGGVFALRTLMAIVLFVAMAVTLWITGRSREIQLAVVVFGLYQLVFAFNSTLSTVLQAVSKVGPVALANVLGKLLWGVGLLVGLKFKVPIEILALPILIAELLRSVMIFPAARSAADLHYRIDLAVTRQVVITSIPFFISAAAIGLGNNLAMSALGFMRRDEREVGWFNATQNLASLAMLLSPLLFWVVTPMLSRANARSEAEMMGILRRAIEGLVLVIAPITVAISVGSDVLIKLAFGDKFAPAATGLSILSLVFAVTYVNMVLSSALVVLGKSWSVTAISLTAIVLMAGFMIVFVPLGRALFHVGGECAGAAMAVIANESCVIIALATRFGSSPIDARNARAMIKSLAIAVAVIVGDRLLRRFGLVRLGIDVLLYVALGFALRLVPFADLRRVVQVLKSRRAEAAGQAAG
jgi:O-antigen/teichoic acid export membrane protein